jgi:hypothetical protein
LETHPNTILESISPDCPYRVFWQGNDLLSHLGQITVEAFKKEYEKVRQVIIFSEGSKTSWIKAFLALPSRPIL